MSDDLAEIERQLNKMNSTATNLETLSLLAMKNGNKADAKSLADKAVDVRVQQFKLYRKKDRLISSSNDWKALTSALELANHYIEDEMVNLGQVAKVLTTAAKVIDVATKILAALA